MATAAVGWTQVNHRRTGWRSYRDSRQDHWVSTFVTAVIYPAKGGTQGTSWEQCARLMAP